MNGAEPARPLLDFAAYQSYELSVIGDSPSTEEDIAFRLVFDSAMLGNLPRDPRQPFGVRCVFRVSRAAFQILASIVSGPCLDTHR